MPLGETRRVDFDRRFVKISRSAKIFPVSEHQHTPSRFDVHHRLHTSPFDARSGSLERGRHGRRPGGKKTKKLIAAGFEPAPFRTGTLLQRLRPLGHAICTDRMTLSHVYRRDVLDSAPEICTYVPDIVSIPTKALSRTASSTSLRACLPPPSRGPIAPARSGALRHALS